MEKESVQKFDLEAAFKALNEVEIPVVKGIRPNRENLQEKFNRKLTSEVLVEDYFDVNDTEELEQASEEREGEIAKAKLARIEKIVDLNAETEEDLLPSYVGKLIMQCPQCMTLFYKNEEDIEKSEENPDVVNINEPCQHCGNSSGYSLIGKVDTVGEDEAAQYDVEDFDENELNLDFDEEESVEEEEVEEPTEDVATEEEEELDLEPIEDTDEEEVKESLTEAKNNKQRLTVVKPGYQYKDADGSIYTLYGDECEEDDTGITYSWDYVDDVDGDIYISESLNEATIYITKAEMAKLDKEVEEARKEVAKYNIPMKAQKNSAGETENVPDFEAVPEAQREAAKKAYDRYQKALAARPDRAKNIIKYTDESLTEDVEINKQMDLYNEFVKYLQKMVEQDEAALEEAKKLGNKEVIAAIEKRLENSKAELKAALPTTVKDEVAIEELPTPEETEMETPAENKEDKKEKKESLIEHLTLESSNDKINGLATAIHKAFAAKNLADSVEVRTSAVKCEFGSGGHITIKTEDGLSNRTIEIIKQFAVKSLEAAGGKAELVNVKQVRGTTFIILDNIVIASRATATAESLTEGLRTWTCWFDGNEMGTVEAETEEEAYAKMEETWPELHYGEYDGVAEVFPEDVDLEEASNPLAEDTGVLSTTIDPAAQPIPGASRLKRKLSATELIVKKLVAHPLFKGLSTRTVQRVLLPYYIEQMGRENLSVEAMVEFFEFEGFAPYVLDNFMTMDPLARKELLKADAKFMEIFNAYAKEYDLFPTSAVDLEPGENEFDYVFNVVFDIDTDGSVLDTEATRSSLKSFAQMYAAGNFDKSLVVESLTEDVGDNLDVLFNSEEFKKPITEKEVETIKAKYEGLEEEVAPGIESEIAMKHIVDTWESVEDLDDETFNKLTEGYLTEVYSNVKSFEATNCDLKDNKLVVEGTITFNSGKNKPTTFVYEAKETADKKVVLEGLNADFATEKAFTLNCNLNKANCLIVESLGYKYTINDTLVEGLVK